VALCCENHSLTLVSAQVCDDLKSIERRRNREREKERGGQREKDREKERKRERDTLKTQ